jgi:hypothetical protein
MYQRARKLHDVITDSTSFVSLAEDQLEALSVAINALHLVDEKNAWILMPVVPDPVCNSIQSLNIMNSQINTPFRLEYARSFRNTSPNPSISPANTMLKSSIWLIWNMIVPFFAHR